MTGPVQGHAQLFNGHIMMGAYFVASTRHHVRVGHNTTIVLEGDTREQADEFYKALTLDGSEQQDMVHMLWDAYWGLSRGFRHSMNDLTDPRSPLHATKRLTPRRGPLRALDAAERVGGAGTRRSSPP